MTTGLLLMIVCSLCIAGADFLFKSGSRTVNLTRPWLIFQNRTILLGLLITVGVFILNITAYRFGDVVVLSPLLQLALVWSMLGAVFLFKERVSRRTIFGACLILGGAIFLSMSPV